MALRFTTSNPAAAHSVGGTHAGGFGSIISDALGGTIDYQAGGGEYRDADRQRIDEDRGMQQASRAGSAHFTNYLRDAAMGKGGPSVAEQKAIASAPMRTGTRTMRVINIPFRTSSIQIQKTRVLTAATCTQVRPHRNRPGRVFT